MCAKIKICLEKIRKEVFRTGSMFMGNVVSVYFNKVIRRNRGGGKRRFNDSFICLWIVLRFAVLRGQNCYNLA